MAKKKYCYTKIRNVRTDEPHLSAYEIADKYNLYTVKTRFNDTTIANRPHFTFAKAIADEYIKKKELIIEELYCISPNGLTKVYPQRVYINAIEEFFINHFIPNELSEFVCGKTNYKFILKQNI